jgi:outer membrane protein assembly factor BamE (lipoprotein component of BamABCDE complex)
MSIARLIGIVLLVLIATQGCVVTRGTLGEPLREEAIGQIKKGVSTTSDVVTILGAPERIVRGNEREIFHYYYYDGKSPALLLLILNLVRMEVKSDNLYVFFGRNGLVEEVLYSKRAPNVEFKLWPFGD